MRHLRLERPGSIYITNAPGTPEWGPDAGPDWVFQPGYPVGVEFQIDGQTYYVLKPFNDLYPDLAEDWNDDATGENHSFNPEVAGVWRSAYQAVADRSLTSEEAAQCFTSDDGDNWFYAVAGVLQSFVTPRYREFLVDVCYGPSLTSVTILFEWPEQNSGGVVYVGPTVGNLTDTLRSIVTEGGHVFKFDFECNENFYIWDEVWNRLSPFTPENATPSEVVLSNANHYAVKFLPEGGGIQAVFNDQSVVVTESFEEFFTQLGDPGFKELYDVLIKARTNYSQKYSCDLDLEFIEVWSGPGVTFYYNSSYSSEGIWSSNLRVMPTQGGLKDTLKTFVHCYVNHTIEIDDEWHVYGHTTGMGPGFEPGIRYAL